MDRRTFLGSSLCSVALTACSPIPAADLKFKLSASGIIDGRFSSASMVFQTIWWENFGIFPDAGKWSWKRRGDALIWNLGSRGLLLGLWEFVNSSGPNFRADLECLSALLTKQQMYSWGKINKSTEVFDEIRKSTIRAALPENHWPRIVWISDPRDYRTVRILPPGSPEGRLDFISRFDGFLLERTEEPINRGIEDKVAVVKQIHEARSKLPRQAARTELPEWAQLHDYNFKIDVL